MAKSGGGGGGGGLFPLSLSNLRPVQILEYIALRPKGRVLFAFIVYIGQAGLRPHWENFN